MRHLARPLAIATTFALLAAGGAARAEKLEYWGTHKLQFSNLGQISVTVTGDGVRRGRRLHLPESVLLGRPENAACFTYAPD